MLAFDRPWLLVLVLAGPALFLARRWLDVRGLSLLFPAGRSAPAAPLLRRAARLLREAALLVALAAAAVAAAGPALVNRRTIYLGRGNEVVFVLDVSPSMAASDFAPSRLEAAKAIIGGFLATRRNETVGLVSFGGEAALVCPPTTDYAAFSSRLAGLAPGLYGDGTALGDGIGTAIAHAARSRAPEKHVVLLTDGENNAGSLAPATAAAAARRFGIVLSVIGVGSRGDVDLAYVDPATGQRRVGTYRSGFDREGMERLAAEGGGQYYAAESKEALAVAFESLSERSASLSASRTVGSEEGLARLFIAIALTAAAAARLLGLSGAGGRP